MTLVSTGKGPEINKKKKKNQNPKCCAGEGAYQEAPLLVALPEGLGFISCTHIGQLSSRGSDHMTLVACTYLDIDTHTRTKKRDSVFRKANIFVYFVFVCGVCRYTYLCMCTRVCTGTDER